MYKEIALFLIIFFSGLFSFAQNTFKFVHNDSVVVIENNIQLSEPWAGGMNNPQFNEMDVNFDCVNDLIIFEKSGGSIRVFINDNIPNQTSYHYAPEYSKYFPDKINDFLLIRDYNNDGKPDLFTYRPGALAVYKNISDSTLKFELYTERLPAIIYGDSMSNVYVLPIDYPVIDDIDRDGKLDIISFNISGIFALFYKNVSIHPDSFWVETDNKCWGSFFENQLNDSIVFNAACKGGGDPNAGAQRHTGSAMATMEMFNNGVKDLLVGDVGYSNLILLRNGGTINNAHMVSANYHYAGNGSKEINLPTFPVPFILDVNNDQRKDLIVCSNQRDGGLDTGNVWRYTNYGSNTLPNFDFAQQDFLVGNQIDVGTGALPVLVDISGDGIKDLVIGNTGYFDTIDNITLAASYISGIAYYKNIGNDSVPKFELVTRDLAKAMAKGFTRISPTFGDLDGDGDVDMIFGESNGSLSYYRNIAPAGQEAQFVLVADTFMGQLFGVQPSPYLYDINGDNLLDLLVGQKNGNIRLYLNTGDSLNPVYNIAALDTLGGIFNYVPNYENNAALFVGKITGSGSTLLFVGDGQGNVRIYQGIDNNYTGTYTQIDSFKVSKSFIGITGADLTGNDSIELIVGERSGGLQFLYQDEIAFYNHPYPRDTCKVSGIQDEKKHQIPKMFKIIPNPNIGIFRIEIILKQAGLSTIDIIDLSGKIVWTTLQYAKAGFNTIQISPTELPQGIYIIQLKTRNEILQSKLVVQ